MKTVLFAPGGMENLQSRDYDAVLHAIRARGYEAVFVPITWQRSTINEWTNELLFVYEKFDPKETILAGFSWGSMAAFIAAVKRPPAALWLFSFSPFFSDDQLIINARAEGNPSWGKQRLQAFEQLHFTDLATNFSTPTLIFMGEDETPELQHRCKLAATTLHARLIKVPRTKHVVEAPAYIKAIQQNI